MKNIYDIQGNVLMQVPVTPECEHAEELMRTDEVRMFWNAADSAVIPAGAYVEVPEGGEKYYLVEPYKPTQRRENEWRYEPVFVSAFYALSKVPFYMYTYEGGDPTGQIISREADWVLTDTPANFMATLCRAIKNETGLNYTYAVAVDLPASKTVTFSSVDIISALNAIANAFETEFWLEKYATPQSGNIGCIHLSFANDGATAKVLTVGTNVNVPSVSEGGEDFFNRFVILGSSRNITQDYQGAGVNSVANKRLTLDPEDYPDGYIDYAGSGKAYTKILTFEDIYPSANLRIKANSILARLRYVIDDDTQEPITTSQYAIYYFQLEKYEGGVWSDYVFDNEDYPDGDKLPGKAVSIHFQTGALRGREFELEYHETALTNVRDKADATPFSCPANCFEIIKTQEGTYVIPALTGLVPSDNDGVILFNIAMPSTYIKSAQERLETAAFEEINKRYLQLNDDGTAKTDGAGNLLRVDLNSYQLTSNPVAFNASNPGLKIASKVTYVNGSYSLSTRVKSLVTKLDFPVKQTVTIGQELTKGTIQELKEEAANANQNIDLLDALNASTKTLLDAYNRTQEFIQAGMVDNYFERGSLSTLVQLKSQYSYLGPKGGLFFSGATLTGTPTPDLYVDEVEDSGGNTVRVLRTPLAFITGGDQIVEDGTPGGGGGEGVDHLYKLEDVYGNFTTEKVKTATGEDVSEGQALVWNESLGMWVAGTVQSGGGSVTSVGLSMPTGFSVSGSPVTSSGTLAVSFASGYSLPTTDNQTAWSNKYDKPSGGIPKTDLESGVQTSLGLADTALQSHQTVTLASGTNDGTLKITTAAGTTDNIAVTGFATVAGNAANGNTALSYFNTGVLPYNHGGTGFKTYTKGDLLYASANNTLAKLAANSTATKKFLTMTSSVPSWGDIAFGDLPTLYWANVAVSSSSSTTTEPTVKSITIGGATFTWVAPVGTTPGYLKINSALLTDGDQIVGSGTPGGGGGGASYLSDLLDVKYGLNPSADDLLIYSSSVPLNPDGTVTGPGWTTIAKSSVGRIYTAGTGLTISSSNVIGIASGYKLPTTTEWGNKADASALGNYLPLSAGPDYPLTNYLLIQNGSDAKIVLDNTDSDTDWSYISFRQNGTEYGSLGTKGSTNLVWGTNTILHAGNYSTYALPLAGGSSHPMTGAIYVPNSTSALTVVGSSSSILFGVADSQSYFGQLAGTTYLRSGATDLKHVKNGTNYTIYDASNASISNGALTLDSTSLGTSTAPIGYATQATRLKRYAGTAAAGGYDLNTMLSGGGITSQYSSSTYWANGPTGMRYGGVAQFNTQSSDTLSLQLAWDVVHDSTAPDTGNLWFRDKTSINSGTWGGWKQIYHSGNFNPGNYLPLAGGTMTGAIKMSYTYNSGANFRFIDNRAVSGSSGWADTVFGIYNAAESSLASIGVYGTADALTYLYIGSNNYNGVNLRINSSSIKWGDDNILHAGNYASYALPRSGGSGYPMTGSLYVATGLGISDATGNGLLVYHPSSWTGVTSSQWGVGAIDSQGVIRSSATNLVHYRGSTSYDIADKYVLTNLDYDINRVVATDVDGGYKITGTSYAMRFMIGSGGTNRGIYSDTSSAWMLYFDASNTILNYGNVGIGTTSPSYNLDVVGKIRLKGSTNYGILFGEGQNVIDGLSPSGYGNFHINYNSTGNVSICYGGGNVGIGVAPSYKLHVAGTILSTGDQVISSDINLKTHLEPVKYTIEDIAKTRAVTFDWKDGRGHSAGSIAQDWKPLIPELVHGEEGNMTLAYGQIALVNTIILAKHETEQDEEIKKLKARVKELEKQLEIRS